MLQLTSLYLWANKLVGSIPESWSTLISVSCCSLALTDVLPLCSPFKAFAKLGIVQSAILAQSRTSFRILVTDNLRYTINQVCMTQLVH